MRIAFLKVMLLTTGILVFVAACTLPTNSTPGPADLQETSVAETLSAIGTRAVQSPTPALADTPTVEMIASATATLATASTPQNPLVVKDSLCWEGPGPQYEVVSAVKTGTRVELLGRGSIGAWWIIDNPIYHDPCWVQADVLQLDPGYNISGLQVFNPPPTPTFTPTPVPTSTFTPTP